MQQSTETELFRVPIEEILTFYDLILRGYLQVKILMKYTPGTAKILDLGVVAVFKTANSAARKADIRAADVVPKVPIHSPQDMTEGSCLIICGTAREKNYFISSY